MEELKNFEFNPNTDTIGEGSQGVVYVAKDKRLGRKVAIKSLHKHLSSDDSIRDRFVEEAKLLAQLDHPTIVKLYDYINEDDRFHLIMEYVKGRDLNDLIDNVTGPINEYRAIDIFIQVLEGIQHIHNKSIIHRDIKPSNILINHNDKIKLLDFGIAKDSLNDPRLTRVGLNVGGTPMYMSPEHVSNTSINKKSDIYCLGVTLWQMVTGKYPYANIPVLQIYNKIENEPLQNAQDIYPLVSKRMNDIISKATSKDPKDRYDSCDSFIRDLLSLKAPKTNPDIEDPCKTLPQRIRIDVKVENQLNAFIIINDKGCLGSELSFYGKPGDKVRIIIEASKHHRFLQQFILNEDRKINVKLIKQSWF